MLSHALHQLSRAKKSQLIFQDQSFSADQLVYRSLQIVGELKQMGLRAGSSAAFCLPNSPELLCWHLACYHTGVVVIPIIYEKSPEEIIKTIVLTQPKKVFVTSAKKQHLPDIKCDVIDELQETLSDSHSDPVEAPKIDPNGLAMVIFSSGSTGKLKGIMHSYKSAYGFMEMLIEVLKVEPRFTYVVAQPMGHIGGIVTTLLTLLHEGKAILLQKFDTREYLQVLRKYLPTHINLHTPLFYELLNHPDLSRESFANIKTCFAGGDTIAKDLPSQFYEKTGARMQTGYGTTEFGIVTVNHNLHEKAGSCGKKISCAEVLLKNELGEMVPSNTLGEMWVKSPACCLGYWQMDELNRETLVDGWFKTGDVLSVDVDGYFWYANRVSQAIHREGKSLYPYLIEQALFQHKAVKVAAVIAKKDAEREEIPIAFVELKQGQNEKMQTELMDFISKKLEPWQMPEKIIAIEKMPLNLTGKIDRLTLQNFS